MSVTTHLLRVFLVDKQLRGLQSKLRAAERFLSDQTTQIQSIETRAQTLQTQLMQWRAQAANAEGETKRLDEKIETIRTQMNSAQTNKEYKAFLTEVNTFKSERDKHETTALEAMQKAEDLAKQLETLGVQRTERQSVASVATGERDKHAAEIRERVETLTAERAKLAADVPGEAMKILDQLIKTRGDEAMAPVEELSRRDHEFNCGSCMTLLPFDLVNGLLSSDKLTRCASCGCVLYVEDELKLSMRESPKGLKAPAKKKAKKAPAETASEPAAE
jgi:hypothetical protein